MKCKACDKLLTDFESTRRATESNEFVDLCNECFGYVSEDFEVTERPDLMHITDERIDDDL